MGKLNRKTVIFGACILLAATGATACVLLKEFKGQAIIESLRTANLKWVLPGLLAMVFYWTSEAINIRRGLVLSGAKPGFANCFRYAVTGFFFSSITPSATGGQPAQLYAMNRDDIHISFGAFSLLAGAMSFQMSSVLLGICGAVYVRQSGAIQNSSGLLLLFLIGFALNGIALTLLLCVMFSESFCNFAEVVLTALADRFCRKCKPDAKISKAFEEYRKTSALLRNNLGIFAKMLGTSLLQLLFYNSIPFFCARALGLSSAVWLPCIFIQSMLFVSVSALPMPGASGVTEGGFAALFGFLFGGNDLATLLILSRTVSFIAPLIISGVMLLASGGTSFSRKKGVPQ